MLVPDNALDTRSELLLKPGCHRGDVIPRVVFARHCIVKNLVVCLVEEHIRPSLLESKRDGHSLHSHGSVSGIAAQYAGLDIRECVAEHYIHRTPYTPLSLPAQDSIDPCRPRCLVSTLTNGPIDRIIDRANGTHYGSGWPVG